MTEFELLSAEVEDLCRVESGLTTWECNFVDDMAFRFRQKQFIGSKQAAKIHELWDKHCGNR